MSNNGIFINEERGSAGYANGSGGAARHAAPSSGGKGRVPELATIPWSGPRSITDYARVGRGLCRELGEEFAMGSDELYAVLIRSFKGHPLLAMVGAPDVRRRAKRVVKRLKRAAELQRGAGVELVKFHAQFRKEFVDILPKAKPEQRPSTFRWDDD
ncbi:unnamed protein product [[Actinomadura] parvosata subsp. kistnae]|uniref:Uncharacterized protein n=1 Tax=[Actinomadura] parvosata subsp. kistnae TaxID=1909395 RepID=A0A1V0AAK5_9ACTN|nr:hypothetical protein [Nonomuraea sp. ATCC 55076]AQZ67250.1 hypothetical protein BKM31_42525 [Nonomuraea sp. ATCC 55076]SPL94533.1 unnamed protein product [Actinomadura parvosata subsp. kistnae]